jgi:flagellin
MTSLVTNSSAMVALQTLRTITNDLEETNNRVSTGLRVNSAADNAAYWSISSTLKSDNGALGAVKDAMALDKNSVDAASTGVGGILDALDQIKAKLTAATSPNVDRAKLQTEISSYVSQIKTTASNTVMNGDNWLSITSSATFDFTKSLVSSFSRTGSSVTVETTAFDTGALVIYDAAAAGTTAAGTIVTNIGKVATAANGAATVAVAAAGVKGFMDTDYVIGGTATATTTSIAAMDISAVTDSDADVALIQAYVKIVDATMQQLQSGATTLGSTSTRIKAQQEFTQKLIDINTSSIGALVDANMEEESTKLKALQVQQQLAVQSLSIANSSTQNIMSLFRG